MREYKGVIAKVARHFGLSRQALYRRLDKFKIDTNAFSFRYKIITLCIAASIATILVCYFAGISLLYSLLALLACALISGFLPRNYQLRSLMV